MSFIRGFELSKIYNMGLTKVSALKHISFTLSKGSLNAIIGPSGSGKSTLMKLIGGFESLSSGELIINDEFKLHELNQTELENYRLSKIGYLHQNPNLNIIPNLTVKQNIEFVIHIKKLQKRQEFVKIYNLMKDINLSSILNLRSGNLSGGEAQRLGLLLALIGNPIILLADEPTSELDFESAKKLFGLIEYVNKEYDQTVILATHDDRIASKCDTYRLEGGRMISSSFGFSNLYQTTLHDNELVIHDQMGNINLPIKWLKAINNNQNYLHVSRDSDNRIILSNPKDVLFESKNNIISKSDNNIISDSSVKTPIITLQDVSKSYFNHGKETNVLNEINISFNQGSFNIIKGPSGSGKTSLLNIITGLDRPTKGDVYFKSISINKLEEKDLVDYFRNKFGIIFQNFNLDNSLTSAENVEMPMLFANKKKSFRLDRINELFDLLGIKDKLNANVFDLSGGQKQRVGIARALVNDPDIIIADEPSGNLDKKTGIEIMALLEKVNLDLGKTIIMVTHDESIIKPFMKVVQL